MRQTRQNLPDRVYELVLTATGDEKQASSARTDILIAEESVRMDRG